MTQVPSAQHPLVAREGWWALAVCGALTVLAYAFVGTFAALAGLTALVSFGWYFRDPQRDSPSLPLAVVAAVDGRVTATGNQWDPWMGRDACAVHIVMRVFDAHSIFSPVEGKIIEQWSTPPHPAVGTQIVRQTAAYQIRTDEGDDVVLEIARPSRGGQISIYYQPGERVGHGRRVGFAPLGCRVAIYAPFGSRLEISSGAESIAAASVVSTLVHESPVSAIPEHQS